MPKARRGREASKAVHGCQGATSVLCRGATDAAHKNVGNPETKEIENLSRVGLAPSRKRGAERERERERESVWLCV